MWTTGADDRNIMGRQNNEEKKGTYCTLLQCLVRCDILTLYRQESFIPTNDDTPCRPRPNFFLGEGDAAHDAVSPGRGSLRRQRRRNLPEIRAWAPWGGPAGLRACWLPAHAHVPHVGQPAEEGERRWGGGCFQGGAV